jgi:hypothetical protein
MLNSAAANLNLRLKLGRSGRPDRTKMHLIRMVGTELPQNKHVAPLMFMGHCLFRRFACAYFV